MPLSHFTVVLRTPPCQYRILVTLDYASIRGSHKPDAIKFSCNNITVKHHKSNKKIVDDASGEANPGDLLAIMGSSRAG